jgi:hypothetical protein
VASGENSHFRVTFAPAPVALSAVGAVGTAGAACVPLHLNVAIDFSGSEYGNDWPPQRTVKLRPCPPALTTIRTLEPSGLRNATECRSVPARAVDAMRWAPGTTNL